MFNGWGVLCILYFLCVTISAIIIRFYFVRKKGVNLFVGQLLVWAIAAFLAWMFFHPALMEMKKEVNYIMGYK